MKLILGLGNVGDQYARTRHNIGFMVIDQLAQDLGATWRTESKFKADVAEASSPAGERLILAKPHTFMNLSGEAARAIANFYKIEAQDIWAVFDELDVHFGRLRIRNGGSGGGHQGVNSLIRHLEPNFVRVRVGISLNDRTQEPSEVYVLKTFNPDEREHLPQVIARSAEIVREQLAQEKPSETTFDLLPSAPSAK